MAKKKCSKPVDKANSTEFKPGDKPYYEYDGTVLNANVPWRELVQELLEADCSETQIAQKAECSTNIIRQVLKGDYNGLCFRAGARLITMHCNHYPCGY